MPDHETTSLATRFRAQHHAAALLVLPNVWDAGTAMLMQSLGAQAVATTSAGVAWAHGYADGDHLPIAVHAAVIQQIARAVSLPISADAEGGYSTDPAQVGENVARLLGAGAVGINLEDGVGTPEMLCRKIEAVKTAAARAGVDVFVNARTDVFLKKLAPGQEVAEVLRRAPAYRAAGADGLFVPAVSSAADIQALVRGQPLPLNVMAYPGLPTLVELSQSGVRRLSAGSAIAQTAWAHTQRVAAKFLAEGCTDELFAQSAGFAAINVLFTPPARRG
jgi:2-methylisocitrate lyase-like PEP mutase family enzyme